MRILNPLLALWLTLLVSRCPQLRAQESLCDLPVVVTRFVPAGQTVELVPDLTAKDFAVTVGGSLGTLKRASVDTGGRRVALILDASNKVSKEEWRLETAMAVSLIKNASALDRFALLLVGVDLSPQTLLPHGDAEAQLKKMGSSRPVTDSNERIYDALLAAANRFSPPEFGDAIFLFGHPDDSGSKATADQVEELILRNHLRFYAVSFTDPLRGKLPPGFDLNKPLPANVDQERIDKISHATGYFFSYHAVEALKLSGQLTLLQGFLGDVYEGIARPYRLTISLNPSEKTPVALAVVDAKDRNIHASDVHYPHFIYPCASQ
jgi:hypothetical protein